MNTEPIRFVLYGPGMAPGQKRETKQWSRARELRAIDKILDKNKIVASEIMAIDLEEGQAGLPNMGVIVFDSIPGIGHKRLILLLEEHPHIKKREDMEESDIVYDIKLAKHRGVLILLKYIYGKSTKLKEGVSEKSIVFELLEKQIEDALNGIIPREGKVLRLRFGLDDGIRRTLGEVGEHFGVTRERIRQIEAKALRRLRNRPMLRKCLKDYLEFEFE